MSQSVGRIQSIGRYPIKSFQGEAVERALLQGHGIFADRPLALRDAATGKIVSGKHRHYGERILGFSARFAAEPEPGQPLPSVIATIDDEEISTDDVAAFSRRCSEALDAEVELIAGGTAVAGRRVAVHRCIVGAVALHRLVSSIAVLVAGETLIVVGGPWLF